MTSSTTFYGWNKPDIGDPANINVVNTMLDAIDTDIKAVSDTLTSKIYMVGEYQILRKVTLWGGGTVTLLYDANLENALWKTNWEDEGNTGDWDFNEYGWFSFREAGIYKISYQFTMFTIGSGATEGYCSIGLYNTSSSLVNRTKTYHRSVTDDNMVRTTMQGTFYVTTSGQVSLFTVYALGIQQNTDFGTTSVLFNPVDLLPFKSQVTVECVRSLV